MPIPRAASPRRGRPEGGTPECSVMAGLEHRGRGPGGVVEVDLDPGRIQLTSIEQLDGNCVERLTSAQRTPRPRPQHPPPFVGDQPLLTNPGLQHELRASRPITPLEAAGCQNEFAWP